MLSGYTLGKLKEDGATVSDIIAYYEDIIGEGLTTDRISEIIDNAYINGEILTYGDYCEYIKCEGIPKGDEPINSYILNYYNNTHDTKYKTLDELRDNTSADIINGDECLAIF